MKKIHSNAILHRLKLKIEIKISSSFAGVKRGVYMNEWREIDKKRQNLSFDEYIEIDKSHYKCSVMFYYIGL